MKLQEALGWADTPRTINVDLHEQCDDALNTLAAAVRELEAEREEALRQWQVATHALYEVEKELAAAREEIGRLQIENKNLAPIGRYNGIDIEGWYKRAEAAEKENAALRRVVDAARVWYECPPGVDHEKVLRDALRALDAGKGE